MQIHSLFPQYTKENRETLFIIGNGFDLHHKISSKYADFCKWLLDNGHRHFADQLEFIFQRTQDIDLWSDFEIALGAYDYNSLYHEFADMFEMDYDHTMRCTAQKEDATISAIGYILEDIRPIFAKWVNSIDIKDVNPDLTLFSEAKYITFNYTKTLEEAYGIPANSILHIHGSAASDEDIVVGHGNIVDPMSVISEDKEMMLYEENGKIQIIEAMNKLAKDVKGVMDRHMGFFKSLSNIQHVIVYGHSLSDIDRPYFKLIKDSICSKADWRFSKHNKKGESKIVSFTKQLGIKKWMSFQF